MLYRLLLYYYTPEMTGRRYKTTLHVENQGPYYIIVANKLWDMLKFFHYQQNNLTCSVRSCCRLIATFRDVGNLEDSKLTVHSEPKSFTEHRPGIIQRHNILAKSRLKQLEVLLIFTHTTDASSFFAPFPPHTLPSSTLLSFIPAP